MIPDTWERRKALHNLRSGYIGRGAFRSLCTRVWMLSTGAQFYFIWNTPVLNIRYYRKQARRTGMAGPLGEMFDHGEKHLSH